uniref:Uncharacterized protein n=1 Tax=Oryza glumipatula TaxID=40148 RepID=A0A0E0B1F5_9ORYZ
MHAGRKQGTTYPASSLDRSATIWTTRSLSWMDGCISVSRAWPSCSRDGWVGTGRKTTTTTAQAVGCRWGAFWRIEIFAARVREEAPAPAAAARAA